MADVPWSCSTQSCVQWRVLPGGEVQIRRRPTGPVLVFWVSEVDDFAQEWLARGSGVPAPDLTIPN